MKIAIISDIHGNLDALQVFFESQAASESFDELWVLGDQVNFGPQPSLASDHTGSHNIIDGLQLIRQGRDLINYIARARTPMPKSTRDFIARCDTYVKTGHAPLAPAGLPV